MWGRGSPLKMVKCVRNWGYMRFTYVRGKGNKNIYNTALIKKLKKIGGRTERMKRKKENRWMAHFSTTPVKLLTHFQSSCAVETERPSIPSPCLVFFPLPSPVANLIFSQILHKSVLQPLEQHVLIFCSGACCLSRVDRSGSLTLRHLHKRSHNPAGVLTSQPKAGFQDKGGIYVHAKPKMLR